MVEKKVTSLYLKTHT